MAGAASMPSECGDRISWIQLSEARLIKFSKIKRKAEKGRRGEKEAV